MTLGRGVIAAGVLAISSAVFAQTPTADRAVVAERAAERIACGL